MKKLVAGAVILSLGAFGLVACGGRGGSDSPSSPKVEKSSSSSVVHCDNIGSTIPAEMVNSGCLDRQGGLVFMGTWDCSDGRVLFGDDHLWGYAGGVAHHDIPEDDPAYGKAYEECEGN